MTAKNLPVGTRDAIHVPFVMVTCQTALNPGDKCSLRGTGDECVKWGGKPEVGECYETEPRWHGVADPFLEADIQAGTVFALYIRRECFSGLTHNFKIEIDDRGGTSTCHYVCNIE